MTTTTKVKTRKIEVVIKTTTIIFDDYAIFELRGNEHSCDIMPFLNEGRTIGERTINKVVKKVLFLIEDSLSKRLPNGNVRTRYGIDCIAGRIEKQFAELWDELTK